ncbi:MAG TPA: YDG domain-containing protein, partial [Ideonella sp.]|nr:YDG domain-containing protein [Ideonella sp.]
LQNTNLDYAFKQYAAAFDDAVFSGGNIITAGTGKGLMYAITPTVTITGSATKTYDASTTAFLNTGPSFSGLVAPNDQGFLDSGAVLDFNDANAGTGKPIAIGGTNPLSFTDGTGNPVYGYAINNQLSGTVTPAPLTINTVNVASRNYDGTTIAGVSTGSVSGYVGSQTLAISASGNFDTKDAGTAKLVTLAPFGLADGTNGGLASNYVLSAAPASASGDITPRPYTLSGAVGDTRNYDGTTLATVSFTTVTGMVGSETLGITGVGDFDTKDVGTGKPISIGSLQLVNGSNGGVVSNYVLSSSFPTSAAGDITPRPVNFASVTAASRAYDSTTLASVTLGAATGLVGDETLILGASGSFDTKDAGTGKTVTVGYSLADGSNGGLASNYSVAGAPATTTADITPKTVFAGAAFALNKAYDGSTAATVSAGPLSGLVGGETLVVNASGNFATKDVGNDQVVAVAYGLADGGNGGLASNYSLGNPTSSALADIVPKDLRIDAVSAANKVYDGNTVASVSAGPLIGLVGSESLGVSASGSFDTKDAGSGKTVAVSGYGLADGANGGLSSNYTLLSAPTSTTADITPKPLSFSAVTAASKVYDGNQQAEVTLGAPVGLVGSETLDFSASGSFDTKDAGTGKTVVLGYSAADGSNGGLASNYSLAAAPASTTADITPKTLVLSTIGVADKVYDGNTTASVTLGAAIGLVGSETVSLSADGSFSDKNVGSDKAVVLSYGVADGSNGGLASNYLLSAPAGSNADITPALLTYVANAATSVAGAALPPLSGSVTGFVAQETLASATTGQAAWTAQVEGPTQVGSYAVLGAGLAAQNYVFTQAEGNSTALTVTAIPPLTSSPVAAPTETALGNSLAALTLPATATTPAQGRVLDVLPAMQRDAQAQSYSFQSLPVASLSQSELAGLLASREGYMNNLFAGAIRQLEQNAALADTPSCASLQQVMAGDCLISDAQLKEVAEARLASPAADAAVASGAVPATPAAPAPTPAVPAPAAATPPAVATAALSFPAKRPVRSASLPQIQRKIAVLIGVDRYSDARIPQLDNAVADARAVGKLFEGSLGYETVVIPNANKRDVVLALNRLAVEVSPRDSVVIYYAGHGALVPATGLGYWQLADSNPDQPQTWMSNSDINKSIAQFGATQVALISDSCYSGSLVDQKLRGAPAETDVGKLLERKAVVVMSSGGNEPVFDSGKNGHSSFAWNLMSTLEKVSTWQAGGNVFERVRFAVARELPQRPQYGTSAAAGHQAGGDYLFEQRQLGGAAN